MAVPTERLKSLVEDLRLHSPVPCRLRTVRWGGDLAEQTLTLAAVSG